MTSPDMINKETKANEEPTQLGEDLDRWEKELAGEIDEEQGSLLYKVKRAFAENVRPLKDIFKRSERTTTIAEDFMFNKVDPTLRDVTRLFGIIEKVDDELFNNNAFAALREYRPDDPGQREYFAGIATDFRVIRRFIKTHRDQYFSKLTPYQNIYSKPFAIIPPVESHLLIADDPEKFPGCKGVNIESILVGASAAYDSIRQAANGDKEDQLKEAAYEIDAFYVPLCKSIGFDALAMALNDEVTKLRLHRGSQDPLKPSADDKLKRARKRLDMLPKTPEGFTTLVRDILADTVSPDNIAEKVISNNSEHGVVFGHGFGEFQGDDGDRFDVRVVWRKKTEGSLAEKYDTEGDPVDLVGITLIVDSDEQVFALFNKLQAMAKARDNITLANSRSRNTPYHVKGGDAFREDFKNHLPDDLNEEDIDEKPSTDDYQLVKMTLLYEDGIIEDGNLKQFDVPVEIQIMTEEARKAARVSDENSHINYKASRYGNLPDPDMMKGVWEAIHARRASMGVRKLTPQSAARARDALSVIDTAPPVDLHRHTSAAAEAMAAAAMRLRRHHKH